MCVCCVHKEMCVVCVNVLANESVVVAMAMTPGMAQGWAHIRVLGEWIVHCHVQTEREVVRVQ